MRLHHHRSGQGLLETTVALSILVTAVISLLVLVVTASVSRSLAESQTVATNLAREAIELVRYGRDTTWMGGGAFDTYLVGPGNDYTLRPTFDPATNAWASDWTASTITDAANRVYLYTNASPYVGTYVQTSGAAPGNTVTTPFFRMATLSPICSDGSIIATDGAVCPIPTPKIGVRATATVQWSERGKTHTVNVEERLYDWR